MGQIRRCPVRERKTPGFIAKISTFGVASNKSQSACASRLWLVIFGADEFGGIVGRRLCFICAKRNTGAELTGPRDTMIRQLGLRANSPPLFAEFAFTYLAKKERESPFFIAPI